MNTMSRGSVTDARLQPVMRSPLSYGALTGIYVVAILVPWALSYIEGLAVRGWYEELVQLLSIIGLSMMLLQFFLTARVDAVARQAGVDNTMRLHTKMGELVGYLVLLHPLLIVAPRFFVAPSFALGDLWDLFTSPETSTGMYAWCLMLVWVLMAVFKERTGLSYEAWRYTHSAGFVAIIILATHHAMTIGRHGRYSAWFDIMWFLLCVVAVALVVYVYFFRPRAVAKQPFRVVDCFKGSDSDWHLTIEKDGDFPFDFDAGQFTWISTSDSVFARNEHPFSIATTRRSLPKVSYVIRELGDYTRQLAKLGAGHRVWVDGPHGVFTQNARNASGVVLIAGGAGIGPIMGLLRELGDHEDKRPVTLIYGNRTIEQMSFMDEIASLECVLNLDTQLVLEQPPENFTGLPGFINQEVLSGVVSQPESINWDFYICGPPVMVKAVEESLLSLSVAPERILYEQLGF
ncbi:ferric reductase-like transmembrane domain-containing protein [Congregibacter brevis]|uniref:Ferric reductase-like transmembrane domain-containing protein n=1 Tax=Congregibacter brevis TaxID=3081201 RepID=A0ABZ0IFV3_9GAMM|nr:ferric reductase-like transmembrane domain-containing protein [Congregibacter sp. IMCC45268]